MRIGRIEPDMKHLGRSQLHFFTRPALADRTLRPLDFVARHRVLEFDDDPVESLVLPYPNAADERSATRRRLLDYRRNDCGGIDCSRVDCRRVDCRLLDGRRLRRLTSK
jgi:hypothetical protein